MGWRNSARIFRLCALRIGSDRRLRHVASPESCENRSSQTAAIALSPGAHSFRRLRGANHLETRSGSCNRPCDGALVGSRNPRQPERVQELRENLDPGEAEAIVLAIEPGADLLLMDEKRGRRTATAAGLTAIGLLGVVTRAKRSGGDRSGQASAR